MINADMNRAATMRVADMDWQTSPSAMVERKRFHLAGPAESGQVTSLVRYLPGAAFPSHGHPEGEEILVLEGVFSDESGDYPAGTHLLNPEGFSHAPFSKDGCVIFVKLRQYAGAVHQQKKDHRGELYSIDGEVTELLSLTGTEVFTAPGGFELFVVSGTVSVNGDELSRYDWTRFPAGASVTVAGSDAIVYVKRNGVSKLTSVQGDH